MKEKLQAAERSRKYNSPVVIRLPEADSALLRSRQIAREAGIIKVEFR
jgi:hypothetical protein